MAAADDRRMSTRATGVVGIAILSSRLLGLVRESYAYSTLWESLATNQRKFLKGLLTKQGR